jgi:hypothetical protein
MDVKLEEKLQAYYVRESRDRLDLHGKRISEDILLFPDEACLGFFIDSLDEHASASKWVHRIADVGDQEGNHNPLEYVRDHVIPYLKRDIPPRTGYFCESIFTTMEKLFALAARQTNYWNDYSMMDPEDEDGTHLATHLTTSSHRLYNPKYNEDVDRLAKEMQQGMHMNTWQNFCFIVRMYIFACM